MYIFKSKRAWSNLASKLISLYLVYEAFLRFSLGIYVGDFPLAAFCGPGW